MPLRPKVILAASEKCQDLDENIFSNYIVSDQFVYLLIFVVNDSLVASTASRGGKDLACIAPWLTCGKNGKLQKLVAKALAGGHRETVSTPTMIASSYIFERPTPVCNLLMIFEHNAP